MPPPAAVLNLPFATSCACLSVEGGAWLLGAGESAKVSDRCRHRDEGCLLNLALAQPHQGQPADPPNTTQESEEVPETVYGFNNLHILS